MTLNTGTHEIETTAGIKKEEYIVSKCGDFTHGDTYLESPFTKKSFSNAQEK